MTVSADVLAAMLKAGCSAEQLVAVVRYEEDERRARVREQNRIRQRKQRERHASHAGHALHGLTDEGISNKNNDTVTQVTRDERDTPLPLMVSSPGPLSSFTPTPPSPPKGGSGAPTPKSELAKVLDTERTAAVIDHRQRIRKPLTAHAAHLLAAKFAACPDPNEAADVMISHGWQGFEPSWLESRQGGGNARAPPRNAALAALENLSRRMEENGDDGPTIEASNIAGENPGPHQAVLGFAATDGRRK